MMRRSVHGWVATRPGLTAATGVTLAAIAAFVWAPAGLLSPAYPRWRELPDLQAAVTQQVADHLRRGTSALPPGLADLAEYWFWWHAIKVVICLVLVTALGVLATGLWRRSPGGRLRIVAATVVASVGTVVALGLLAVNAQSTAVPLMALMPLLPAAGSDAPLDAARNVLADHIASSSLDPAEKVLVDAAAHYSWAMAVAASVAAAICGAAATVVWRHRGSSVAVASRGVLAVVGLGVVAFATLAAYEVTAALDASSTLLGLMNA